MTRALSTIVAALFGLATGTGFFTFVYAKGGSYLFDDPQACGNCHVMKEQLDGWSRSSHRSVATCNDCHTPAGFFAKYWTKASNGYRHSVAFTTGRFHEPIQIKPTNRAVAEEACRKCHTDVVQAIDASSGRGTSFCMTCHRDVGHIH